MHVAELYMISNFSAMQRLQIPEIGEYGVALPMISNFTIGFFPSSLSVQTLPDRAVAVLLDGFLNPACGYCVGL